MYITFHRGKQDFSGGGGAASLFFRFNYRLKNGNGFLHSTGSLHDLEAGTFFLRQKAHLHSSYLTLKDLR